MVSYLASGIEEYLDGHVVACDFCSNYQESEDGDDYENFRVTLRDIGWRVYRYHDVPCAVDRLKDPYLPKSSFWKYGYRCPVCMEDGEK